MKFNTIHGLLSKINDTNTEGIVDLLSTTLKDNLKDMTNKEDILKSLDGFADGIKDDVYRYREFSDPKNQLRLSRGNQHDFDMNMVQLFDIPAFYEDCRVVPKFPEECRLKQLESRHSDDGDEYYCEIANTIWANHSGTFYVTARDYDIIRQSEKNYNEDKNFVRIDLDRYDVNMSHEDNFTIEIK